MIRLLYRALLALYPPAFRRRFRVEMLGIFDAGDGGVWMLMDATRSVVRQWLLRTQLWVFSGAIIGGLLTTSAVRLAAPRPELVRV